MSATDDEARRTYLISMRERLQLSQTFMGLSLGMSLRAYSDLETGNARVRKIHILAAERVLLREAAERSDKSLLNQPLNNDIKSLSGNSNHSPADIDGPHVRELGNVGTHRRYIIVRYLKNSTGSFDTQALSVSGSWVDRPEGFVADSEVTFYSGGDHGTPQSPEAEKPRKPLRKVGLKARPGKSG